MYGLGVVVFFAPGLGKQEQCVGVAENLVVVAVVVPVNVRAPEFRPHPGTAELYSVVAGCKIIVVAYVAGAGGHHGCPEICRRPQGSIAGGVFTYLRNCDTVVDGSAAGLGVRHDDCRDAEA